MHAAVVFDASDVRRVFGTAERAIGPSARQLLRLLAIQGEREATRLASGSGDAGSYPIPIRTGFFRRGFKFRVGDRSAFVFNDANYAKSIHDGFRPYGNPNATPIKARPYFDDMLKALDLDKAGRDWERSLQVRQ